MKNKTFNILITGATGYIGYNFSKYLLSKEFFVHLLVREGSNLKDLDSFKNTIIHYYNGNFKSIENVFDNNQIDFVFHLATFTQYDIRDDHNIIGKLNDVCIGLTSDLLGVIKKQEHSVGFINVGTIWQTFITIENSYTLFKTFQEEIVKFFSNNYGIKSISLLLTDTYGPNDLRPKLLNQLKVSIKENREMYIKNPNAIISLVYIDDVSSALYHSLSLLDKQSHYFQRYKIQADKYTIVRDLINICEKVTSITIKVKYAEESQILNRIMNNEIETLPMWKPTIDLENGLVRFFEDKE